MHSSYYLALGSFLAFTLGILSLVMLSRNHRHDSLALIVAKHMGTYHLSFYEMLETHQRCFTDIRFLVDYSRMVETLKRIDRSHWQKAIDIDIGLLSNLFYSGEQCLTELLLAMHNNKLSAEDHRKLRSHYRKLRLLIHILPQQA